MGTGAVLLLLVLVYPLWFPWLLGPVAARLGVQFEDYQRRGFAQIELRNVQWTDAPVFIRAERLTLQMPHRWLWTRLTGAVGEDPQVIVQNWRVEVLPSDQPSQGGIESTGELLNEVQSAGPSLGEWIHSLVLTNGEVRVAGETFLIPSVMLRDERFTVDAFESRAVVDLTDLSDALNLRVSNQLARATIELKRRDANWKFAGGVDWQFNHFVVDGWFDDSGWLPAEATVGSDSLQLDSALLGLEDFPGFGGGVQVGWTNGSYTYDVHLTNQPATDLPPQFDNIAVQAIGSGDFRSIQLKRFELVAPFLRATLDKPLIYDFAGSVEAQDATLNLWADLSQVQAVAVEGQLSGMITVKPTIRSPLRLNFELDGTNIVGAGLQTRSVAASGLLNWPLLQVTNLTAELESGGRLNTELELEIDSGETNVAWNLKDLKWQYDGALPVTPPESLSLESINARGRAAGIWPNLSHTGMVDVAGLELGVLRASSGRLSWAGRGLEATNLNAHLANGASTMDLKGSGGVTLDKRGTRVEFNCGAFTLVTPKGGWELDQPFQFRLLNQTNGVMTSLSSLKLAGPDSQITMEASVHWPSNGSGELTVQGLSTDHFQDFLAPELPILLVPEMAVSFSWNEGPLTFDLNGGAQWIESSNLVWAVAGQARADEQRVRFDTLRVTLNGEPCVELNGSLPLRVEPTQGWRVVDADVNSVAQFDARVEEQGPLWSLIEKRSGVRIDSPTIQFRARGEYPKIHGELLAQAAQAKRVTPNPNTNAVVVIPDLENIQIEAEVSLGGIKLRKASAEVLGQPIEAQARWDVPAKSWAEWFQVVRAPDWKQVVGNLRMEHAELSALSLVIPGVLAPIGTLNLDLVLETGLRMSGHLTLTNGATRFLRPLGALRDIDTDITLDGWNARLNTFNATLGGRPVQLLGELTWRADGDRQFDLRLTGKNLSLVRDPELFVRADLDLHLQKSFDQVAALTGEVQLQRSLLFRNFNSLIGFDRDQPQQRPPYFSVPQAPFGNWTLDVRVKGDRFLSVFSPAFKGEVSAGLQLLGTLREPFAIGTVTVDSGKILFPFGTLLVENGRVDLTREDPYRPRLDFRGQGQNYGYTVTVDLRGPMDVPNLTFQSVPPLTAQQILLMLTAGEIPRSDFGYTATDRAGQVGFYVGKEFVNRFIGNTSTTERLTLRSGEDVTNDGKLTYSIEYRLTDRWSAFGEYDRFQNLNSGLKFKVLSK